VDRESDFLFSDCLCIFIASGWIAPV